MGQSLGNPCPSRAYALQSWRQLRTMQPSQQAVSPQQRLPVPSSLQHTVRPLVMWTQTALPSHLVSIDPE